MLDDVSLAAFINISNFTVVNKVWGKEIWFTNEPEYCSKLLVLYPGYQCSLHFHKVKKETFIVLRGEVLLESPKFYFKKLYSGYKYIILPNVPHRFSSETGAWILETSTHHEDSDSYRIEPSRKIETTDKSRFEENIQTDQQNLF